MSNENKLFFHDSDTDVTEERINISTLGDDKLTRNVSEKEYDDEYLRLAKENNMEIKVESTIHGTKEQQDKVDKGMLDFNKKFINFDNPRDHKDEVLIINFLFINKKMSLDEIADHMGFCIRIVKEFRSYGFSDCHVQSRNPYKIIWQKEYSHITVELINVLITRLNNKVRTDKKNFVIKYI
jgi:hypothetical protein